jgi:hypothetical protein
VTAEQGRRARRRLHVQALERQRRDRLEGEAALLAHGDTVARARDLRRNGSDADRALLAEIIDARRAAS